MNFPDKVISDESKMSQGSKSKQFINKSEEFFQKKVPLVDVMNSIKEIKEFLPIVSKLEKKIAIQEDRIYKLSLATQYSGRPIRSRDSGSFVDCDRSACSAACSYGAGADDTTRL